jgi:hypothetical protein
MNKVLMGFILLSVCTFCFAQQSLTIKGSIPRSDSNTLYRIQVGAFKIPANSEGALARLRNAGLYPAHEYYRDFTRVFLGGIHARDIRLVLKRIETIGFREVWISQDRNPPASEMVVVRPGNLAPAPPDDFAEFRFSPPAERPAAWTTDPAESRNPRLSESDIVDSLYYTLKIGESKTVETETIPDNRRALWTSYDPDIAAVDARGKITGIRSGSTVIEAEVDGSVIEVSVAVVPGTTIYHVPKNQEIYVNMDRNTRVTPGTVRLAEYKTEPTSRLAYRFVNPKDARGASGINGGIDVLSKGPDDTWMWTTYSQGGFFYDLNGAQHKMTDGVQQDPNGVVLTVEPSFAYIDGVPYLQLEHKLKNTGNRPVSRQKFGAGADIMIHNNDHAPIAINDYGVLMTDINDDTIESMNLRLVGKTGPGITPVSTLWIGRWEQGNHLNHVYENGVDPAYFNGTDSAVAFSYQNISLKPGETKSFILRFTLARNSN